MSIKPEFSEGKLQKLSAKLTKLAMAPNLEKLAKMSLELIISRRNAIAIIEGDYPKELKVKTKKSLSEFEELEKRIVHLYGLGLLSEAEWTHPPIKGLRGVRRDVRAVVHERRI
ncbi:MAG: hypothetical protein IBV52_08660 [Candidatus Bathyarchaeota archaeon]